MSQYGVVAVQSAPVRHSTQALFVVLQRGAAASVPAIPASAHWESLTHPGAHACVASRHTGPAIDVAQSAFARHPTQVLFVVSQSGVTVPMQSVFVTHCTHCCDVGSQTGAAILQSAPPTRQPTHAPVVRLHIGVTVTGLHWTPPSTAHDARHV